MLVIFNFITNIIYYFKVKIKVLLKLYKQCLFIKLTKNIKDCIILAI
jgi:hypothetical protein